MEMTMKPIDAAPGASGAVWTGRVLSGLAVAFLAFDALGKLLLFPQVVEASAQLGFTAGMLRGIGLVLALCTALYAMPRTAAFGAVLLTGYLGGAVCANLRLAQPLFSHTLFPVYFGIVIWLGLFLRDPRVRALVRPRD